MRIHRVFQVLVLVVLVSALYAALTYTLYTGLTERIPGANDFFSRWMGARALFLRGENPYSDAVTREIQLAMYGRLAYPGEDQVAFAYPLYAAFVAAPLVGLSYPQAQALWMALLIVLVVASALILARLARLPTSRLVIAALLLTALLCYPAARGILLGQYTLVSFFLVALAFAAIAARYDLAAGALIALATIKPQVMLFLAPALLFWAARQERWRFVCGAIGMFGALIGVASLFVPGWLFDFVRAIGAYSEYVRGGPPVQTLVELFAPREWTPALTLAFGGALIAWMIWVVWRARDTDWGDFQPALSVIAIVTTLTAVRIGSPDQIFLLIPWIRWMSDWLWRRQFRWAVLAWLAWLILPWTLFAATLRGNAEDIRVTIALPLLSLALFVWQMSRMPVREGEKE